VGREFGARGVFQIPGWLADCPSCGSVRGDFRDWPPPSDRN